MKQTIVFLISMVISVSASALSVVFINPGKSNEAYWVAAAESMRAAARSLNIDLEIQFAERDNPKILEIAQEILARPKGLRPDFVVVTNDYAMGPKLLRLFDGSGIRCFFAFSTPTLEEQAIVGKPRQYYKYWIGSLEPHAADAGYLTASALIAKGRAANLRAPDGKLHMLAIAGDRSTPASILRNEGMLRAVKEAADVVLEQTVYSEWSREKATMQSDVLFARYPTAHLLWAGSDQMAFGAMDAWEKRGGKAGQDALFSGVNTSREALEAIKSGRMSALAGGHFITGAWALVMIYDYANGSDFAAEGFDLDRPMFILFDAHQAELFLTRFGEGDYNHIDFKKYSKSLNPRLKSYNFSFEQLLR